MNVYQRYEGPYTEYQHACGERRWAYSLAGNDMDNINNDYTSHFIQRCGRLVRRFMREIRIKAEFNVG